MPSARDVYDHPKNHWTFLTASQDTDFEGQHFDRKEAGRPNSSGRVERHEMNQVRDIITECVSAFANINQDGSLLVIGVSTQGRVKGINHLNDNQRTDLTRINNLLVNQTTTAKFVECCDETGSLNQICLIYVPYTPDAICETLGNSPKAWVRQGTQNEPLSASRREQLCRDKRIVYFEQRYCCPFDLTDVDQGVLQEFRKACLADSKRQFSDEEFLYEIGAIVRDGSAYAFTKAGLLFFASNPQRIIDWAYIRLLRFQASVTSLETRGLPTFEKNFGGPLATQIRNMRIFFKESGFFKIYQRRNPDGGFTDEPEYPYIAIDEAILNAVAHRDHGIQLPIECEAYMDGFLVRNPGRIQQRDHDVPEHFSLDNTTLVSAPRNPKLIEWLKLMRDERGAAFVRALSEGTKQMRDEMASLNLPAPIYDLTLSQTTTTLLNNAEERESKLRAMTADEATEFANLFPISVVNRNGQAVKDFHSGQQQDFLIALRNALRSEGWFIHGIRYGRLTAHPKGATIRLPENVRALVRLYPAYSFQFRHYWDRLYLCVDYSLEVRNRLSVQALLDVFQSNELINKGAIAQWNGWQNGRIISIDEEWTRVRFYEFENEEQITSSKVIPSLPPPMMDRVLSNRNIHFDLHRAIKEHSLSLNPNAPRIRADKTQSAVEDIERTVFPLTVGGMSAVLSPEPVALLHPTATTQSGFFVTYLPEPNVEFNHHRESADIREGITRFGAFNSEPKMIELVPMCLHNMRDGMAKLIERLKVGAYKYRGSERTFSTRLSYSSIITIPSPEQVLEECKRLLREHPEWIGDQNLNRLFLVHIPEQGYVSDDESSPYYQVKRFLLEQGIPCQMVDTPTLLNPDWKDLNLALNIIAKCGVTPWVLPDAIPDADFFLGLSYTQSGDRGSQRLMGYANVFNEFGRWEFYSGNTQAFPYHEKTTQFGALIKETLERLSLSETPSIYFHYSAKFSREDREAILKAARSVRPHGTYTFAWINMHHNVRLYDSRPETDGSLRRGSYVLASPNQIYLSTTGFNPYRKSLGTPLMLEINVRVEQPVGRPNVAPDMRAMAVQMLNLTKLNWASTDSLCGEPITTKYAGDIAYLTAAFLRQSPVFKLHSVLEKTPWFI